MSLPVVAAALVVAVAAGLRLQRHGEPAQPRAGDTLHARVRVGGWAVRSRLVGLVDVALEPGLEDLGRLGAEPDAHGARGRPAGVWRIAGVRRGDHLLPAPRALVSDPLGLARVSTAGRGGAPGRLVVRPRAPRLRAVPLLAALIAPGARGREPSWGELDRVRDYRDGDMLGRVHWGQTAKRGRLQTKELRADDPIRAGVALALDERAPGPAAFELAVTATAALARHLARRGVPVALAYAGACAQGWPAIEWALAGARPRPAAAGPGSAPVAPARVAGRPPAGVVLVSAAGRPVPSLAVGPGTARVAVLVAPAPGAVDALAAAGVGALALAPGEDVSRALARAPRPERPRPAPRPRMGSRA